MRVLHIYSDPSLTHGASIFETRVAERLRGSGIVFDYLVTGNLSDEDAARYAQMDSRVFVLPLDTRHGLFIREWKVNRQYYRFFKAHPYEIVYADTENALRAVHLLMARLAGVRVRVLHAHNTGLQTESRASAKIARMLRGLFRWSATDYFACSHAAAQWLFPKEIVRKRAYRVLKNGVDLNAFRFDAALRSETRRRYALEDRFVLGTVGRMVPQKNQKFLIDVLASLRERIPEAALLIVGDGPLREALAAHAQEKDVSDRVIFAGNVPDVPAHLCAMDFFALTSVFEGFGIVNIEAQATGLPCLMSDAVPQEAKSTDRADFLPLSVGASAWADAICAMRGVCGDSRPDLRKEIAQAGFSIDDTVEELRKFYQERETC